MSIYKKFVKEYKGPKLTILTFGGGVSLAKLLTIPGASRVIHSINNIYSDEARNEYFFMKDEEAPEPAKLVSQEWVEWAHREAKRLIPRQFSEKLVVVSAALPTNRLRKGPNHAWFSDGKMSIHVELAKEVDELHDVTSTSNNGESFYLEALRQEQDNFIAEEVLKHLLANQ